VVYYYIEVYQIPPEPRIWESMVDIPTYLIKRDIEGDGRARMVFYYLANN